MFELKTYEKLFAVNWSYYISNEDRGAGTFWFVYDSNRIDDPEKAILQIIQEFYKSLPEDDEVRTRGYNPNWGDAVNEVEFDFEKHGVRLVNMPIPERTLDVDHDHPLFNFDD